MKMIDDRCFGECMGYPICCIYMIMRISTGQKYIGQSINLKGRVRKHYSDSLRVDEAIKKYGKDDFIIQVLEIVPNDIQILNDREDFWVNYYNTYENPFHYNEKPGGYSYCSSKSEVWDYANEICDLYQNNIYISQYDLAKQFNCSQNTIGEILRQNNIEINYKRNKAWDHTNEICELYQNTDVSIYTLAEQFNCSYGTISEILTENNIETRGGPSDARNYADEICDLYQNANISIHSLSKKFNCSHETIRRILEQNNIKRRPCGQKSEVWNHSNEICDLYQNTDVTTYTLAEQFNCSSTTICEILTENNIETRGGPSKAWMYTTEICDLYQNTDATLHTLAKQFNCSPETIRKILQKNNIKRRRKYDKRNKVWNYADEICDLYQNTNMSTGELGRQFGCSRNLINAILKENNIKINRRHSKTHKVWNYVDEICELYQNTNISMRELGRQFNCSHETIKKVLQQNNIK